MHLRPRIPALILAAIGIISLFVPLVRAEGKVEPVGTYTSMRYTEEHAYGYSVEIWREGDKLFGFLIASSGLAGDSPTGLLEDVEYNAQTQELLFGARLTKGLFSDREHRNVPSRDVVRFKGHMRSERIMGIIISTNELTPKAAPIYEKVALRRSEEESASMTRPGSYLDWRRE